MNGSRKILGIALAGVVGLYFAVTLVETLYLAPRRTLVQDVEKERLRYDGLMAEIDKGKVLKSDWQTQTSRTLALAGNRDAAHKQFRDEIASLLKTHGLSAGHTLTPQQPSEIKKDSRKGFIELPLAITIEGSLKHIIDFLAAVQKLPYYVSVDKVVLNPNAAEQNLSGSSSGPKPKKAGRTGGPDGPSIKAQLTLSTLCLPKAGDAAHVLYDAKSPDQPPALKPRSDAAQYAAITENNLFRPYEAPQIEKSPEKIAVVTTAPVGPTTPPIPPVKPDSRVLIGTPSLNGEPIAYLQGDDKGKEPEAVHLNGAISDDGHGKLVLIHPLGIVVRVKKAADPNPKNYFVALGKKMSEREELTPAAQPDVYAMLSRVLPPQQ